MTFGTKNKIRLNVFKDNENPSNNYAFYINIYDSKNNRLIHQYCKGSNWGTVVVDIDTSNFNVDNYTIKIISSPGGKYLGVANLIVKNSLNYTYNVVVSDTTINYGSNGNITMKIYPAYNGYYNYDFYLKVYDSDYNNELISKRYYNSSQSSCVESYCFNPMSSKSGDYKIRIVNYNKDSPNCNSKLIVKPKPGSTYVASITSDVAIEKGESGKITMLVSPIDSDSNRKYNYDFYLQICDPKGRQKLFEKFKNEGQYSFRLSANIDSTLVPGVYTINLIDGKSYYVMDSAKLIVGSSSDLDYSVSVSNTNIELGSQDYIEIYVSSTPTGHYTYDFNLKIYDSNDNEIVCENFNEFGLDAWYTGHKETYKLNKDIISPGKYTIKIFNNVDNRLMSSAKLNIQSTPHNYYSVRVDDITAYSTSDVNILMKIDPPIHSCYNAYDFYLKIYDSNNVEKISKRFCNRYIEDYEHYIVNKNVLSYGKYTIKIINYQDNYLMDTANLVICKKHSSILADDLTIDYNKKGYLVVTLIGQNDVIVGEKIFVNLNGAKTLITDDNGQVKVPIIGLNPNTYTATITFDENSDYEKITKSVKVIVKKATPKLTSKAKTFKKSLKTKKYTVTLKTNQNKVMKNTKLTLKVNGKTYSAKTNAKGQATFKITKLTKKGKFNAVVTYKGNVYYNKVVKKVQITIK